MGFGIELKKNWLNLNTRLFCDCENVFRACVGVVGALRLSQQGIGNKKRSDD